MQKMNNHVEETAHYDKAVGSKRMITISFEWTLEVFFLKMVRVLLKGGSRLWDTRKGKFKKMFLLGMWVVLFIYLFCTACHILKKSSITFGPQVYTQKSTRTQACDGKWGFWLMASMSLSIWYILEIRIIGMRIWAQ